MIALSSLQMRELDRYAIKDLGIPGSILMENAGRAVVDAVIEAAKGRLEKNKVLILCGKGNNGGDGFVAARHLLKKNVNIKVVLLTKGKDLKGDALLNYRIFKRYGGEVCESLNFFSFQQILNSYNPTIIIDAIFGTGIKNSIKGYYVKVIDNVNRSGATVISVDIPSGLDSDSGVALGISVKANVTVTLGHAKLGLLLGDSANYVGDLIVRDISLPNPGESFKKELVEIITPSMVKSLFKPRKLTSHKGTFGHVGIIAGSSEKSGAAKLAAVSTLRAGAGLVTILVPKSAHSIIKSSLFNVMSETFEDAKNGQMQKSEIKRVLDFAKRFDVVAIGPGLNRSPGLTQAVLKVINETEQPLIVDADGLNALEGNMQKLKPKNQRIVFTPHPKEMARIMKVSTKYVQSNRLLIVERFIKKYKIAVVLKGFRTIIGFADGSIFINPTGNPGMSTAGTGDVLCGILSAYLASQKDFKKGVLSAVFNHGLLGDLVCAQNGERGILATDLINKMTDISKTLYPSAKLPKIEEL